jgi:hypothetical protein
MNSSFTGLKIFQVIQHLVFQFLAGRFLDGASLIFNGKFFKLPFLPRPKIDRAWEMRNARTLRANFSFVRLGVGIHVKRQELTTEVPSVVHTGFA